MSGYKEELWQVQREVIKWKIKRGKRLLQEGDGGETSTEQLKQCLEKHEEYVCMLRIHQ